MLAAMSATLSATMLATMSDTDRMEIRKYDERTYGWTYELTGVGARDTCVSKKTN